MVCEGVKGWGHMSTLKCVFVCAEFSPFGKDPTLMRWALVLCCTQQLPALLMGRNRAGILGAGWARPVQPLLGKTTISYPAFDAYPCWNYVAKSPSLFWLLFLLQLESFLNGELYSVWRPLHSNPSDVGSASLIAGSQWLCHSS